MFSALLYRVLRHAQPRDERHAGEGRREDRRDTEGRTGGIGAAAPVTSRRELEALLLEEPAADRDDIGIERDSGVLAHLGQCDLHAERGAVRAV